MFKIPLKPKKSLVIKTPIKEYGPCKRVVLFTNARDESHIKEWAAHHLLLGFDRIYIFDHKSVRPIKNELCRFKNRVIVERCEMDGAIKIPLMKLAVTIAKNRRFDWMLYLDADEFLVLNKTDNVKNLLNRFKRAHTLSINWLMFGTNHHVKNPEGLLVENYTKSDEILHNHVKTFVRPNEVVDVTNPHFYIVHHPQQCISIDLKRMNPNPHYGHLNETNKKFYQVRAFIAHYMNQSEETYLQRKINRPTDDTSTSRICDIHTIHNEHNDFTNNWVKNKYAIRLKQFLSFCKNKVN